MQKFSATKYQGGYWGKTKLASITIRAKDRAEAAKIARKRAKKLANGDHVLVILD